MIRRLAFLNPYLTWVSAIAISLGIFPSLNALKDQVFTSHPEWSTWVGPLNFLKLSLPFLVVFIALNWKQLPLLGRRLAVSFVALGTFSTWVSARACDASPLHFREWVVIVSGIIVAGAFALLDARKQARVLFFWFGVLTTGLVINYLFPELLNAINRNIFDPTLVLTDRFFLQGFYDTSSFGKFLAWAPWILGAAFCLSGRKYGDRGALVFIAINLIFLTFALRTTQRGPFVGGLVALAIAAIHYAKNRGNFRILARFGVLGLVMLGVAGLALPKSIIDERIKPLFSNQWTSHDLLVDRYRTSISQRSLIWQFAWKSVKEHPTGKPCINETEYHDFGIPFVSHSHNLFLEQTRTRGWLWGLVFFVFWIYSAVVYWRRKDLVATTLLGGLVSIAVLSLVDHPWFVLNHSIVISVFLFSGFLGVGTGSKNPDCRSV